MTQVLQANRIRFGISALNDAPRGGKRGHFACRVLRFVSSEHFEMWLVQGWILFFGEPIVTGEASRIFPSNAVGTRCDPA